MLWSVLSIEALKYIDENGVPFHNQSTKYELVTEDGKRYPPKYVVVRQSGLKPITPDSSPAN